MTFPPLSTITRFFPVFCLALLAVGCDQPVATAPAGQTSPQTSHSNPVPPAQPPAPAGYSSVDAAVSAFKSACAARDGDEISRSMKYLASQSSAVGPMGQIANDSSADVGTRVAATRVLAMIGNDSARGQILAAAKASESKVRVKAAESLGAINPSTTPIVDQLITMLDDSDRFVKSAAIRSLKAIGPQAKRAEPKLQQILNSEAPEQLRSEAHAALKKIAPRVGFTQGELDE